MGSSIVERDQGVPATKYDRPILRPIALWTHAVELSRYIAAEHAATAWVDVEAAVVLAQTLLLFQNQIIGFCGRTPGRR
jgi:hypothetical protein